MGRALACGGRTGRLKCDNFRVIRTKRRLPHIYVLGQPLFVTFRLRGTLPMERRFPAPSLSSGEAFVALDRLLDQASSGPCFLRQPDVAGEVLASIEYGAQRGDYELHAWVIMPNHVHLLITPRVNVSKALGSLKAGSAKSANLLLGRAGQTFWQDESYDHFVRNDEELRRIQRYIENNPVTAGLVSKAEDYVWSSAGRPARPPQTGTCPTTSKNSQ